MQRRFMLAAVVVVLVAGLISNSQAGTRDDCIAQCKAAAEYVKTKGVKVAIKEMSSRNNRFVWNDGVSYVFLMDMDCKMLAHPIRQDLMKSANLIEAKDVDGKPFFIDFIKAAQKGKGWAKYSWEVPGQGIVKPKHTFIYRIPETDYFVGAGFYVMSPGVYY